ncbi:adenosylcobinamide-GDP ribazoletransferase [Marinomonas sp. C2222]|uniref:Adenosylcobinamide-GDP ribazoletransferase n=1 Tax=Marinomonas sargassi TaxID=2984494 RepID=A0ABT2YU08_9GAMM|nr:adenosylcobinamide-GDP ribazoletransferase [Marinomonas sargassi]MCV2403360.1 adenosylcobinamide-GDP ribazoletransferase [Marinomonas sargassi]
MISRTLLAPHWQGFKRSLVTYTRIPLKVDWSDDIKHTPSVCFLPWVGVLVALLSAWPLWLEWSTSIQALFMLLTAVLITGGFHEDGLMDACDGLVGGFEPDQRLSIMKDSRIGSYAALAIWFSLTIKWLLLSELLTLAPESFLSFIYVLSAWCFIHAFGRFFPLILMHLLEYVSLGNSKSANMLSKLSLPLWALALAPCVLFGVMAFNLMDLLFVFCFSTLLIFAIRAYLHNKIKGFNGDTLGASEQVGEAFLIFCVLVSYS